MRVAVVLRDGRPVAQVCGCNLGVSATRLRVAYRATAHTVAGLTRLSLVDPEPCRISYDIRKWRRRALPWAVDVNGRGQFLVKLK